MKRIIEIALFAGILSMIAGCSDNGNSNEHLNQPPSNSADCWWYLKGFTDTYRDCMEHDGVYFAKVEVTAAGSYGMKANIIEDIKGNFKENSSITLWSHWEFGASTRRYKVNDVLLILMSRIDDVGNSWAGERHGDYLTIGCSTSILLFSEGNVTGRINTNGEEITVPWQDLQDKLLSAGSETDSGCCRK
jgi:hypothetical protein